EHHPGLGGLRKEPGGPGHLRLDAAPERRGEVDTTAADVKLHRHGPPRIRAHLAGTGAKRGGRVDGRHGRTRARLDTAATRACGSPAAAGATAGCRAPRDTWRPCAGRSTARPASGSA